MHNILFCIRSHSGYKDELAWAAGWIYRRTGISTYLKKAKQMYKVGGLSSMVCSSEPVSYTDVLQTDVFEYRKRRTALRRSYGLQL